MTKICTNNQRTNLHLGKQCSPPPLFETITSLLYGDMTRTHCLPSSAALLGPGEARLGLGTRPSWEWNEQFRWPWAAPTGPTLSLSCLETQPHSSCSLFPSVEAVTWHSFPIGCCLCAWERSQQRKVGLARVGASCEDGSCLLPAALHLVLSHSSQEM